MLVSIDLLNNFFKVYAIIGAASLIGVQTVALEADIFVKIENTAFSLVGFRSLKK